MTGSIRAWLHGRNPRPPTDLRDQLLDALEASSPTAVMRNVEGDPYHEGAPGGDGGQAVEATVDGLLEAARSVLGSAVSRTGRVRETAFDLLVADALVTYACEAALETEAPEDALASVLAVGAEGTA